MSIFGLGLHVIIAIFFAIHALRNGQQLFWLLILFAFPLLGSIVYFVVVVLPQSRLERGVRTAGAALEQALDPGRDVRAAQDAFELTPTAHNQMRLANAMLDAGMSAAAVAQFDACLQGPFANDPEIALGAARAKLENGQPRDALALLSKVQHHSPRFRLEQVSLTLARALAAAGHQDEARAAFADAAERFGSVEARAEYAIWAIDNSDIDTAEQQLKELEHTRKHMTKYARSLHQPLFKRLDTALAQLHSAQ